VQTPDGSTKSPVRFPKVLVLSAAAMGIAMLYLLARISLFLVADYLWYEKIPTVFLLFAEAFIITHGVGYFLEIFHVSAKRSAPAVLPVPPAAPVDTPPVAIIVSSFKEPLEVIEATLISFSNLTYPNKHLYFLDDTRYDLPGEDPARLAVYRGSVDALCRRIGVNLFRRKWRGAKAGMINDFLAFTEGGAREGFEFHPYSGSSEVVKDRYIIVFDADQNPFPRFVEPLITQMELDPKLAFIQTPQYYTNFEANRIARAAGLQQAVFYEYICEGKSIRDAMFCCGTNVIFRREALLDVGGFDETSVTEDFATSLKFHLRGWRSAYRSEVMAFGMGPEDLGGYFKQQFRWARGTVGLLRQIIPIFLRNPRRLTAVKWWEYFLSGTHYFIGPVFLILVSCPILYLLAGVPSYLAKPEIYLIIFLPYIALSLATFFLTLGKRRYRARELVLGQLLMGITFPVYVKASLSAILGLKSAFVTTPKGASRALPWRDLWAQVSLVFLNLIAIVWGANRLMYEREHWGGIAINIIWCCYHLLILSSVFYFNTPEREVKR
jgi:cellulose synthase (UDP-forming)